MSTLTKVLVVLLTLSATILCGIVVTYAASATNYKAKCDDAAVENKELLASKSTLQSQLSEGLKAKQDEIAGLQDQVSKLTADNSNLQSEALTLKANRDELQEKIIGWNGIMQKNNQMMGDLQQQLTTTRGELDKLRAEMVTDRGQLSQVRASFEEKSLQLKSLERENMRLVEEKSAMENKAGGRAASPAVTSPIGSVRPSQPVSPKTVIDGRLKEVRMDSMLASMSIGSSNGVKVGDVFFVVRGDQFVCNITVTNVDVDTAVGQISMLNAGLQPQAGDAVTNKL